MFFRNFCPLKSVCGRVMRGSHTDIKVPDFSKHMRNSVADPNCPSRQSEASRKLLSYTLSGILLTSGIYSVKGEVHRYVKSMNASADVLALAKIEINLSQIPEDRHMTFKWRGKPLFVWNRPEQAVKAVRQVPLSTLRDPQRDEDRVQEDKWFVCVGVCTHLGCVPLSHQGDFGGYYCPCHGSHFDISGRARKGPAPTNLVIPPYTLSGSSLVVG
ncbi:cytochrome b-c1 complex subunit Rieske, mitochondrial [Dendroctonus ponderosae]|uniref:Cytochrome b-c1 complex subunit Rieske, mitochondrial n=1 Tax=Dendroctonus ponderosae TaxID=77166 RepID=U4UCR7_DENPD|nr:cytochrome b-c1 complex subunit Rieske, mitochondrial [Dendroctonus ponderosae]ERL88366.1 hypothetical protein D910_05753 [Dendroctonus ponderosae]KAH1017788.1 hypothetical protein HUJ05_008385 [Dendroctonus ponderosae]